MLGYSTQAVRDVESGIRVGELLGLIVGCGSGLQGLSAITIWFKDEPVSFLLDGDIQGPEKSLLTVELASLPMIGFGLMKTGLVYAGGLIPVIMTGKAGITLVGGGGSKGRCVSLPM